MSRALYRFEKSFSYKAPARLVPLPRPRIERLPMQRKMIFDAVRRMLGRGFRQTEVAALDAALDHATGRAARSVSAEGIGLIQQFEGCARLRQDGSVEAYPDPGTGGAPWTIGWGATGPGIAEGT